MARGMGKVQRTIKSLIAKTVEDWERRRSVSQKRNNLILFAGGITVSIVYNILPKSPLSAKISLLLIFFLWFILIWIQQWSTRCRLAVMTVWIIISIIGSLWILSTLPDRKFPKLEITGAGIFFPELETSTLGGINWDGKIRNVRVYIENIGPVADENINFLLRFNVTMFATAQLSEIPDVHTEISWGEYPVKDMGLILQDEHGNRYSASGKKLSPIIHLTVRRLNAGNILRIIAAIDPMYEAKLTKAGLKPELVSVTGTYERHHEDGQVSVLQAEYSH